MSRKNKNGHKEFSPFRERLYEVIFEADTPSGKLFDIVLLIFILASVIVVMLETVPGYDDKFHKTFIFLEWVFTIFFTFEYITRIYTVHSPKKYITSFYGIVDLLSILPAYIGFFLVGGANQWVIIRALRLLRVFRIFKLGTFLFEGQIIMKSLKNSRDKIFVFLFFILIMVTIFGSVMYIVESSHGNDQFDSIPRSVYWAIVTITTVGYGEMHPQSPLGQFLASFIMIIAYTIIAVPTGIVTSEFTRAYKRRKSSKVTTQVCSYCMKEGHDEGASYCYNCGNVLHPLDNPDAKPKNGMS